MWSNHQYTDQGMNQVGAAPAAPTATLSPQQPPQAPAPSPAAAPGSFSDGAFDIPASFGERIELCKFLASANLLPQALRGEPANVLLIMHKAMALQIPLSVALEQMHVIDGKVGHSAELLRAQLYRHGHVLRWIEISDKQAVGELVLKHDRDNPRRETFTMAQAQNMGLTGKDNWKKDPASMLVARCSTRIVSRHCPEIAVALGDLTEPDEINTGGHEPGQTTPAAEAPTDDAAGHQRASELYQATQQATSADEVKDIGTHARQEDLLNVAVDGEVTLQQALLQRIQDLSESAAQPAEEKPASSSKKRSSSQ